MHRQLSKVTRRTLVGGLLAAVAPWLQAQTMWLDDTGRVRPATQQAVRWLVEADQQGLRPADYAAAKLSQAVKQAESESLSAEASTRLEDELTRQVLAYLTDLRHGRVDAAAQLKAHYNSTSARAPDLAAALRDAVTRGQPEDAVRAAIPPWAEYPELQRALTHYLGLGEHTAWSQPLPPVPGGKLQAGQRWAGLPALSERLRALGDLEQHASGLSAEGVYTSELQEAVRAFQERHGLLGDGVLGKATLDALAVPPARRAEQIALAMERLRLTPLPESQRFVTVNVPEFMLRAHRHEAGAVRQDLRMRVIVGKALDTRTPLFDEEMRWIEFSPYWNIPPSIARSETLPKLRANPGYLISQGMEFVGPGGQVSTEVSPQMLDAVRAGQWRIRQRPGPRNALGDIKFMLPNNQNIYLHHTPSTGLFDRARRDFSHGCVRIEDPVALAQWVLFDQPDWTEARIRQSMGQKRPVIARLAEPVPVLLIYQTAIAESGIIKFVPDLYGQDAVLEQALRKSSRALNRSLPSGSPEVSNKFTLPIRPNPSAGKTEAMAAQYAAMTNQVRCQP